MSHRGGGGKCPKPQTCQLLVTLIPTWFPKHVSTSSQLRGARPKVRADAKLRGSSRSGLFGRASASSFRKNRLALSAACTSSLMLTAPARWGQQHFAVNNRPGVAGLRLFAVLGSILFGRYGQEPRRKLGIEHTSAAQGAANCSAWLCFARKVQVESFWVLRRSPMTAAGQVLELPQCGRLPRQKTGPIRTHLLLYFH